METLISSPGVEQEQGERQWWCPTRCRWTCTTMTAPDRSGTLPIFAPASSSPSARSTSPLCPVVPTPGSYVLMANIHGRASPTSIFSPSELTNFSPSTLHKDYLQREVKWDFFLSCLTMLWCAVGGVHGDLNMLCVHMSFITHFHLFQLSMPYLFLDLKLLPL